MMSEIPVGHEGMIPHLVVDNCAEAISFYHKAFGAMEVTRKLAFDGRRIIHAALRVNGHLIYLCDDFPEMSNGQRRTPTAFGGSPVTIHRFVEDCDAAAHLAQLAGAEVIMSPRDTFWGDRYAVVRDPFGHSWSFAQRTLEVSQDDMANALNQESV